MSRLVFILNGPNLNLLGKRQPHIYGHETLADVEAACRTQATDLKLGLRFHQSNREYELVDWIHEAIDEGSAIIINPAAYSFTSIAILDALKMFPGPIIELHISNIHRREAHYHKSYVSLAATAIIAGLGARGYATAIRSAIELVEG